MKGIIYWGGLRKEDLNVLVAYADSSLSIPRSQGCRMVLMNGAVISFTSKKHSTTDDSAAAAELTEQHLCACDVEGLRNLMQEIGLENWSLRRFIKIIKQLFTLQIIEELSRRKRERWI
jgi:hypothetical protein